jgi:hypothetical protein
MSGSRASLTSLSPPMLVQPPEQLPPTAKATPSIPHIDARPPIQGPHRLGARLCLADSPRSPPQCRGSGGRQAAPRRIGAHRRVTANPMPAKSRPGSARLPTSPVGRGRCQDAVDCDRLDRDSVIWAASAWTGWAAACREPKSAGNGGPLRARTAAAAMRMALAPATPSGAALARLEVRAEAVTGQGCSVWSRRGRN